MFGLLYWGLASLLEFFGRDTCGPLWPVPRDLWAPPVDSIPAEGNFVFLQTHKHWHVYTPLTALISVTQDSGFIKISMEGNEIWIGEFRTMNTLTRLENGYYDGSGSFSTSDRIDTRVNFKVEMRNSKSGWFAVDQVSYEESNLTFISLRFFESSTFMGAVRWSVNDQRTLQPVFPPPKDLWHPPQIPDNYLYFKNYDNSTSLYSSKNATFVLQSAGNELNLTVYEDICWSGRFKAMHGLQRLSRGYYGDLRDRYWGSPLSGFMKQRIQCHNIFLSTLWLVIDEIVYKSTQLVAVKLRFGDFHDFGALNWSAANPSNPGPVYPPPASCGHLLQTPFLPLATMRTCKATMATLSVAGRIIHTLTSQSQLMVIGCM